MRSSYETEIKFSKNGMIEFAENMFEKYSPTSQGFE
jgi:hypothetical protein